VRLVRRQRLLFRLATLIAVASATTRLQSARAQDSVHVALRGASVWQAGIGVAATNWLTWSYNCYVQHWPWSNVSLKTWGKNFREGLAWDDDCFLDNQLAPCLPWKPLCRLGPGQRLRLLELASIRGLGERQLGVLGENVRPSLNDFINTTLGGMAIGEVTYRLGSLVRSRPDGGGGGVDRQLASLAVSPVARVQSLVHRGAGAAESTTGLSAPLRLALGRRQTRAFVRLDVRYGDPFDREFHRPYDAFDLRLDLGTEVGAGVNQVAISGLLAGAFSTIRSTPSSAWVCSSTMTTSNPWRWSWGGRASAGLCCIGARWDWDTGSIRRSMRRACCWERSHRITASTGAAITISDLVPGGGSARRSSGTAGSCCVSTDA
jgi:hypothetical protein